MRILVPHDASLRSQAHEFVRHRLGSYLLPRSLADFDRFASRDELWVALDDSGLIATCYVARPPGNEASDDDESKPSEFGGVLVDKPKQGNGIASALGTIALASHALHTSFHVISHVHVENTEPIDLLTNRLGFKKRDGAPVSVIKAELEKEFGPISMKADEHGVIYGDTYDFQRSILKTFAERIESGKLAKVGVAIENKYFSGTNLALSVQILKNL